MEVESKFRKDFFSKLRYARIVNGFMLDVTHMNNHQIDVNLVNDLAKTIIPHLLRANPDVFITAEASGIGLATIIATIFGIDYGFRHVIFAKKANSVPNIMRGKPCLSKNGISPTKKEIYSFYMSKTLLKNHHRFYAIDDFLRTGATLKALVEMGWEAGLKATGAFVTISVGMSKKILEKELEIPILSVINIDKISNGALYIDEFLGFPYSEKLSLEQFP